MMKQGKIYTTACLVILSVLSCVNTFSQDIEQVIKAPALATNGGISFNQVSYFSPDTNNNQEPYSYYLSGNINANLFGVLSLPFSFAYTNNQLSSDLPQPFNRLALAPSYKWITAYVGYASMTFSPYTLTGHEFMGGGVELSPGKSFKFSIMYGRLNKAVKPDTLGSDPSYLRTGGGFKIEYLNEKFDIGFNVFKSEDDMGSLGNDYSNADSTFIAPEDNICGSVSLNFKMVKSLTLSMEYAMSALNSDISKSDSSSDNFSDFFLEQEGDVSVHDAYKISIKQSSSLGQIGATYERVSPNYRTHGAYYFTNDFENITANFSTSIKKRVNLAMDAGYQHDDLENQKANSSKRLIYSINVSSAVTKRLNVAASLSNIQTYVHIDDIYKELSQTNPYQNLDTLSFTQLNLTESANVNYVLQSNKERRQNINAAFTYQQASEEQENDTSYQGSRIYNSSLSYQFSMIPQRLNISTTLNNNYNIMPEMTMSVWSANLSVQKSFYEKIKVAFIGTYSNSSNQQGAVADIVNLRLSGAYTLLKRHTLNLSAAMVNNKGLQGTTTQYNINLSYSYMFNFLIDRKDKKMGFEGNF